MKTYRNSLFLCILLTLIVAGCGPNGDKNSTDTDNSKGEGSIDSTRQAHFDTSKPTATVPGFITASIKANLGEIKLLQLGQQKATDPQLKQMAGMMIQQHNQMLSELKTMAPTKQATIDSTENDITKAAYQNLSSLQGKDFDNQWTAQLLQLHENTVDQFRTMLSATNDVELKQWLTKTLPVIETHRDMLAKKPNKQPNLQKGQVRE